jgi:hypothetical protein
VGASKAVLIHAVERDRFTIVLADAVRDEIDDFLTGLAADVPPDELARVTGHVQGWFGRIRLERWPTPSPEALRDALPRVLPALRHLNDLPAVVTAIQARPDWVIAENEAHWNERLATVTGLRIATPRRFLRQLSPPLPS